MSNAFMICDRITTRSVNNSIIKQTILKEFEMIAP